MFCRLIAILIVGLWLVPGASGLTKYNDPADRLDEQKLTRSPISGSAQEIILPESRQEVNGDVGTSQPITFYRSVAEIALREYRTASKQSKRGSKIYKLNNTFRI
jgi:hypothetical protein